MEAVLPDASLDGICAGICCADLGSLALSRVGNWATTAFNLADAYGPR
jgi:hypothetical protein